MRFMRNASGVLFHWDERCEQENSPFTECLRDGQPLPPKVENAPSDELMQALQSLKQDDPDDGDGEAPKVETPTPVVVTMGKAKK